ncbi:hypothetical protein [Xenorhabdus bovienii]|uniref:hypothetical protein n=1 Tax=Xenorhabdus bovienii TaxID=40576 RepID=UPI0023B31CA2|nr:hypothetical protein [Xenorhabdus bovienii]MDE9484149.1 hypothetical protein [Xenorhabdus bovienii]
MTTKSERDVNPVVTKNFFIELIADDSNYKEIYDITDMKILSMAMKTSSLFQNALSPAENDSLRFDVNKALQFTQESNHLSVVGYSDIIKITSNSQAAVMVELVVDTIKTILGVTLSGNPLNKLTAVIESAYTQLYKERGKAWIFWEKKQEKKTTYQYNITFSIQAGPTGAVLMTCPIGLTINVNKEYERVLFITLKDIETYSTRIQALNVAQIATTNSVLAEAGNTMLKALIANGPRVVI